jgi:acyl-CoA-binding protein
MFAQDCTTQNPPIIVVAGMLSAYCLAQEKAKRNAWQKIVDEGVKPADAQKRYVQLVKDLKEKHGFTG